MKLLEKVAQWLRGLFGKRDGSSSFDEEKLLFDIESARSDFRDRVRLVEGIKKKLEGLEGGGGMSQGDVDFCKRDLQAAQREAMEAYERANRLSDQLRAWRIRRKSEGLAEAPVISTADLGDFERIISVSRDLIGRWEKALRDAEAADGSGERMQTILQKPRPSGEASSADVRMASVEPATPSTRASAEAESSTAGTARNRTPGPSPRKDERRQPEP